MPENLKGFHCHTGEHRQPGEGAAHKEQTGAADNAGTDPEGDA